MTRIDVSRYENRFSEAQRFCVPEETMKFFLYSALTEPEQSEICSCGHPKKAHRRTCKIAGELCGCEKFDGWLWTKDIRPFFQTTNGIASGHALHKGMEMCIRMGIEIEHKLVFSCDKGPFHGPSIIVGVTKFNRHVLQAPVRTVLLCSECIPESPINLPRTNRLLIR